MITETYFEKTATDDAYDFNVLLELEAQSLFQFSLFKLRRRNKHRQQQLLKYDKARRKPKLRENSELRHVAVVSIVVIDRTRTTTNTKHG